MTKIVDIHGHYVFGVDDGAETLPMALDMIHSACVQGVTDIVCTSHDSAFIPAYLPKKYGAATGEAGYVYRVRCPQNGESGQRGAVYPRNLRRGLRSGCLLAECRADAAVIRCYILMMAAACGLPSVL